MKEKTEQELREEILRLQNKVKEVELKAIGLYNENQQYKMDIAPDAMRMKAELNVQLEIADTFIKSGAFPNITKHQAYVLMKAGNEMGLGQVESLQSLYITPKGKIEPYGKGTVNFITRAGYNVEYLEETEHSVKVRVWHPDGHYDRTEVVTDKDQVIANKQAIGFAKKNKMRFHGCKMHLSFNLAHLIKGTADLFTGEFLEWQEKNAKQLPESAPFQGLDLKAIELQKNIDRIIRRIKRADGASLLLLKTQAEKLGLLDVYEQRIDELELLQQKYSENEG